MYQRYAYFVDKPRTIEDLMQPHRVEAEHPFHIVKTIQLSGIDYANFITDMLADRSYIEENYHLCSSLGSVNPMFTDKAERQERRHSCCPDTIRGRISRTLS